MENNRKVLLLLFTVAIMLLSEAAVPVHASAGDSSTASPPPAADSVHAGQAELKGEVNIKSLPLITANAGPPVGVLDQLSRPSSMSGLSEKPAGPVKVVTGVLVATPSAGSPPAGDPGQTNVYGGFDGVTEAVAGGFPPDVQMAKGPTHIVEMTNFAVRVSTLSGQTVSTTRLGSFFICGTDFCFDPQVFYDQISGRWFAAVTQRGSFTGVAGAVSVSSDPTMGFCVYSFGTAGPNPDQATIATSDNKFMMSANIYDASNSFIGYQYDIADKTAMLSCPGSVPFNFNNPDRNNFSVHPVYNLEPGADLFAVENLFNNNVREFRFCGAVASVSICDTVDHSIGATTGIPTAPQRGTTFQLETGGGRVLDASHRLGTIWLTFADGCTPGGDSTTRSCIRLIQLSEPFSCGFLGLSRCINVLNDFDYGLFSLYLLYPALSVDLNGNLGFVFGYSSSTIFPSLAVAGWLALGGSLTTAFALRSGSSFSTQQFPAGRTRYGDYFAAHVDPNNNNLIYVAGEYMPATNSWGTWMNVVRIDTSLDPTGASITLNGIPNVPLGLPAGITASGVVTDALDHGIPLGEFNEGFVGFVGSGAGGLPLALTNPDGTFSSFGPTPSTVGSFCVQAVWTGDAFFLRSNSLTQCFSVLAHPTSTTITPNPSSATIGDTVAYTATVTDTSPFAASNPTGTVTWDDGRAGGFSSFSCTLLSVLGSLTQSACSITYGPSGSSPSVTVTGSYPGDSTAHSGSSGSSMLTVSKRTTSVSITPNPSSLDAGSAVTYAATVTDTASAPTCCIPPAVNPIGAVSWMASVAGGSFASSGLCMLSPMSGSSTQSTCTIVYTAPTTAGNVMITGTYSPSDAIHSGNSGTSSLEVQDFSVPASPTTLRFQPGQTLTSTITAVGLNGFSGTVALATPTITGTSCTTNCPVARLNTMTLTPGGPGATLTITTTAKTPVGTYTITVQATSGSLIHMTTVTLLPPDFTLSATPVSPASIAPGTNGMSTVSVKSLNPFAITVSVTAAITSAPPSAKGVSISPTKTSLSLGAGATMLFPLTIATKSTATPGTYTITVTATDSFGTTHTTTLSFTVT